MRSLIRNTLQRLVLPACAALLFIGAAPAQATPLCTQSAPAVSVLDPGNASAVLPDITVDCAGNASDTAATSNLQIFFAATLLTDVLPTLTDGATNALPSRRPRWR